MAKSVEKTKALGKINEILERRYAEILKDMTTYTTVQCGACKCNFYFDCTSEEPKIEHGVISNAHGVVEGHQFRFLCPSCGILLRVDEDEIELRAWAVPNSQHS